MLVGICSAKGSPGATSLALALAAAWDDQVTLLEADPAGSDLVFRCRHASGREVATTPNILGLAAAVRSSTLGGVVDPATLAGYAQPLGCGVQLVPGVPAPAQARSLGSLWSQIAHAAVGASGDVVADLGRLDRTSPTMQLASATSVLIVVCQPSLESVLHARDTLTDLAPSLSPVPGGRLILPAVVAPARQMVDDAADVDQILAETALPVGRTVPVAHDPRALTELEGGGNPRGRLARSHLMRSVRAIAEPLHGGPAGGVGETTAEATTETTTTWGRSQR